MPDMRRWLSAACIAAVLCGTRGSSAQATPPLPKGQNTITGQLLDGRDDSPIVGAVVTLTGYMGEDGTPAVGVPLTPDSPSFVPQRAMTGNDGRFLFRELPRGRYAISAVAFGYVADASPPHWVAVADEHRPTKAVLRLWKASSISGTVTDERGDPLIGVPITALRRRLIGERVTLEAVLESASDDRGQFRLAPLRPGSYLIGALSSSASLPASVATEWDAAAENRIAASQLRSQLSRAGLFLEDGRGLHVNGLIVQQPGPPPVLSAEGRLLAYRSTFYPGTGDAETATAVMLDSGDSRDDVDLSLHYSTTVRVSGTVAGPEGPLTHVSVRLVPAGTGASTQAVPPGSYVALTDAAGVFTFVGVPPALYEVTSTVSIGPGINGEVLWASQRVAVNEKGLTGLDIVLERGIAVTGRVEFRSERGAPRPELATVGLRPVGATSWSGMAPGSVGADGTFKVNVGRLGPHEVYVSVASSAWSWIGTSLRGRPLADGIAMVTEQGVHDLLVTLSDAPPKLVGTVAMGRETPNASVQVIVFPADTALWRQGVFHTQRVRSEPVPSSGSFEMVGLPVGAYYVAAVPEEGTTDWMNTPFLQRLTAAATTVTLRIGEVGSVALKTTTLRPR